MIQFLKTIKRAYLDPSPSGPIGGPSSNKHPERLVDIKRGFQGFANVRWFSDREKDEIDVLVGVGLKKCVEGVRALEAAEKSSSTRLTYRSDPSLPFIDDNELACLARKAQHAEQTSNPFTRLLRLPLGGSDASFEQFSSHRASILWFLNQRLTELSKSIKDQQELRAQKKIQKLSKGGLAATMAGVPGNDYPIVPFHMKLDH